MDFRGFFWVEVEGVRVGLEVFQEMFKVFLVF